MRIDSNLLDLFKKGIVTVKRKNVMRNLASVSREEQKQFVSSFDHVLSDVDGVLWVQLGEIPCAIDGIHALRKAGKTLKFVSNNSLKGVKSYTDRLTAACRSEGEEVVIPTLAIIDYLKSIDFQKEAFVIGTPSFQDELKAAGIRIAKDTPDHIESSAPAMWQTLAKITAPDDKVGAVIIDMDFNLNYLRMQKAVRYLSNPDVIFLKGAGGYQVPVGPKFNFIGPGYFHRSIENVSGRLGRSLAKPSPEFNKFVVKRFNITDPSKVLFMGDSIAEDMEFATKCGYKKLLLLTGNTRKEQLDDWQFPEEYKPEYYVEGLKNFADVIEGVLSA